jgi:hypothetical protein
VLCRARGLALTARRELDYVHADNLDAIQTARDTARGAWKAGLVPYPSYVPLFQDLAAATELVLAQPEVISWLTTAARVAMQSPVLGHFTAEGLRDLRPAVLHRHTRRTLGVDGRARHPHCQRPGQEPRSPPTMQAYDEMAEKPASRTRSWPAPT